MTHPLFRWAALERHPLRGSERYFFSKIEFTGFQKDSRRQVSSGLKPAGLWYACGGAWLDWIQNEQPDWAQHWKYLYRLTLGRDILFLRTKEETREFSLRYPNPYNPQSDDRDRTIDWAAVSDDYAGIEVCPYHYDLKWRLFWYRAWDVASGCIWDPRGLGDVELITSAEQDWRV